MEKTISTQRLIDLYRQGEKESGLGFSEHSLAGGGIDGCTTAALGIPTIDGLGPRGTGFHTTEERIELNSRVPKAQALARLLMRELK